MIIMGAAIQYQRIQCQHIQSQRFAIFYCYLLTIDCKYEQLLYILLSKKTNISKMTSDLLGSNQQFQSNSTRGVGTKCVGSKCVGTKQLRPNFDSIKLECLRFLVSFRFSSRLLHLSSICSTVSLSCQPFDPAYIRLARVPFITYAEPTLHIVYNPNISLQLVQSLVQYSAGLKMHLTG